MKFLVAGNSVSETVVREEDGLSRYHTGGVGAIMARELARAGADVTFVTTGRSGSKTTAHIAELMEQNGAKCLTVPGRPPQDRDSSVTIRVRSGNPCGYRGGWARMGGIAAELARLAPLHDWTLLSLNLDDASVRAALASGSRVAVNATTRKLAPRLAGLRGLEAASMNRAEHLAAGHVDARYTLVTDGPRGMTLHRPHSEPQRLCAPPVPAGTDFIGAGDAATAGLVYALAGGEEPGPVVQRFVAALMDHNASGYTER